MTAIIYNSLASSLLNVTALSSPTDVTSLNAMRVSAAQSPVTQALVSYVAININQQRMSQPNPMQVVDLEYHISDITIETSAQGSSLLTVSVIDPGWMLLRRDPGTGASFIDVDDSGYLWPPIELTFPPDVTDATWRLCQCKPTTDSSGPNIVLTFEDKIVSILREHDNITDPSCGQSNPNETRAEFIERVVRSASGHAVAGDPASGVGIRFRHLLNPSDFSPSDLTSAQTTLPASATPPSSTTLGAAAATAIAGGRSTRPAYHQPGIDLLGGTGGLAPIGQLVPAAKPVSITISTSTTSTSGSSTAAGGTFGPVGPVTTTTSTTSTSDSAG